MEKEKITYYPGCTLPEKAKNFEQTIRLVLETLKVEIGEMPGWHCCGAAFPLETDNLMKLLAPARNLARAAKAGGPMVTGCTICYHVLKRTQYLLDRDEEKKKKIADFLEEEIPPVEVLHLLGYLARPPLKEGIEARVSLPLTGMKIGCYYGCLMLRPGEEIGMDDPENPSLFEKFMNSLGGETVDFPHRTECCGSYLTVNSPGSVLRLVRRIVESLANRGAEAVVTACPLCYFNLDGKQKELKSLDRKFADIPVFYFTELAALALGKGIREDWSRYHRIDPLPLLKAKGLVRKPGRKVHARV